MNIITQRRIDRSRGELREADDDGELHGMTCFTQRVCRTPVPKEFKLPNERQKFDGLKEPESWLADYLQTIQIVGGNNATTMHSM
jgi:hypothetical protein